MKPYTVAKDEKSITCHTCGKTSYNPNDVKYLYCAHCNVFHEDKARHEEIYDKFERNFKRIME